LTLFGLPFNIISVTAGFLVFRTLDIWKPYPIRLLENKFSGGIGIVLDDVVAGILSNVILRVFLILIY
jgi:phosphatidylglycerophosphatase A